MYGLTRIVVEETLNDNSGFILGGNKGYVSQWPVNPDGEKLFHLFSIDCEKLSPRIPEGILPISGYLSVFSTYSDDEYFLDSVTYFGDEQELNLIKSGFTFVSYSLTNDTLENNDKFIPERSVSFLDMEIEDDDYPMISLFSNKTPHGLDDIGDVGNDYHFVCQIYSSDFPEPFQDALGLSDAIGYLFIRNKENGIDGLFFVQTA
ncbi:DUF1963 domain-containing protein [Xenorhabdus bovienii]|uniref:DUF1963 domain-containing protein n=1 Tax=Xenorhabdus bovienii str. kraussei Becker Underwood TaxID=1398204 RepID=A0A077Q2Z1_XENBV|nr:DUF1963 domain-containing protein [Xenorhabdus bovienii]CDH26419.1 hypothetical protein XBKB1_680002 [Xenorhabdus bovienii str. kraussei Becker Underwood]